MNEGYIYVHRKIADQYHWVWQLPDAHFKLTMGLLLRARWSEKPADFIAPNGEIIKINRGEYATSIKRLAETCYISVQNVRSGLRRLEKYGFLTRRVTHGISVITIVNYEGYQAGGIHANTGGNTPLTRGQPTPNQLNNKVNNDNKDNIYTRLKNKWNEYNRLNDGQLTPCRTVSDATKGNINARLNAPVKEESYTEAELFKAIKGYAAVMEMAAKGETEIWSYSYPFRAFWLPRNELDRWFTPEDFRGKGKGGAVFRTDNEEADFGYRD